MKVGRAAGTDSETDTRAGWEVILACSVGNIVEWFDFTIYGFTAAVIATVFFEPLTGNGGALLAAFAAYGVAFVARPVGAVFFGWLGDRYGRRSALAGSITLMGAATAGIGLLPSYAAIGVVAPLLLVLCRLVQGFSAGGEYTGAMTFTIEHAPDDRRGLWIGITGSSVFLGSIGATLTVVLCQALFGDAFADGGWRWPFVIGGVIAVAGLLVRRGVDESPAFRALESRPRAARQPLRDVIRNHRPVLLISFVYFAALGVLIHMFLGYMPTYLGVAAGLSPSAALLALTAASVLVIPAGILVGHLADRVGRRVVMRAGIVGAVVIVVPAYMLIGSASIAAILAALTLLLVTVAMVSAGGIAILEMYPTEVRFSGMALPYNGAYALFAGTAPLVSEALVQSTGSLLSPGYYATGLALVALVVLFRWVPETRHVDLRSTAGGAARRPPAPDSGS